MIPGAPPTAELDHLVVAAATLADGVAWCEATLGITPGPGGRHALFGTHNRLLRIDAPAFPAAYLEIIAVEPEAPLPSRRRWFGLDEAATRARLVARGPHLLHAVARTTAIEAHLAALAAAGCDAGEPLAASRDTPEGPLRWRIAVCADGALRHGGALPTLIEWQGVHPTRAMAASPVRLRELMLGGLPAALVVALNLGGASFVAQSAPRLRATFDTPRGPVTLESE